LAFGGIILCGGGSRRMGQPKATLPFGPETMLQRIVRLVGDAANPIVVVSATGQELPELPADVILVHDREEDRGPLEGLVVGLQALKDRAEGAFVTACDVPLLKTAFVRRMIDLLGDHEIASPSIGGFDEPLAAVYRTAVLPEAESLLAANRRRPALLLDQLPTRRVSAEELADVDPQLQSLTNVNTPDEYEAALAEAGFGT